MSKQSREGLVRSVYPHYLKATKVEKGQIPDEFVAATGYHGKHAIHLLEHGAAERRRERCGRPRTYMGESVRALVQVWRICNLICGNRLALVILEIVPVLERYGELQVDATTREQLLTMSVRTMDRRPTAFK